MTPKGHELSSRAETAIALLEAVTRDDYETSAEFLAPGFTRTMNAASGTRVQPEDERQQNMEDDMAWRNRRFEYEYVMDTVDGAVIVQHTEYATHTGKWHGIPATGKEVVMTCCHIFRFDENGLVASLDTYQDNLPVAIQLGAVDLPT